MLFPAVASRAARRSGHRRFTSVPDWVPSEMESPKATRTFVGLVGTTSTLARKNEDADASPSPRRYAVVVDTGKGFPQVFKFQPNL